jgi:hypothetical protein
MCTMESESVCVCVCFLFVLFEDGLDFLHLLFRRFHALFFGFGESVKGFFLSLSLSLSYHLVCAQNIGRYLPN